VKARADESREGSVVSVVKKIFSALGKLFNIVLLIVLIVAIVSLAYLLLGAKGKSLPFLEGYQIRTVMSGSMEPALPVGSVALIKKQAPSEFVEGDIMTFMSNDPLELQSLSYRPASCG
jgi:signal peptidase